MSEENPKFCPKCGRNFADTADWCEHCGVKLVDKDTFDVTKQLFEEDTVTVHTADTPLEAEILREILEENGIVCALWGDVPSSILPFTVDGLAKVRILVLEEAADEAREIIQEALAQRADETDLESDEEEDEDEGCDS